MSHPRRMALVFDVLSAVSFSRLQTYVLYSGGVDTSSVGHVYNRVINYECQILAGEVPQEQGRQEFRAVCPISK